MPEIGKGRITPGTGDVNYKDSKSVVTAAASEPSSAVLARLVAAEDRLTKLVKDMQNFAQVLNGFRDLIVEDGESDISIQHVLATYGALNEQVAAVNSTLTAVSLRVTDLEAAPPETVETGNADLTAVNAALATIDARLTAMDAFITASNDQITLLVAEMANASIAMANKAEQAGLDAVASSVVTKANKSTKINTGGLLTGGGDLTTDRSLIVSKATAAEVDAGIIDHKAVTPASLMNVLASIRNIDEPVGIGTTNVMNTRLWVPGSSGSQGKFTELVTMNSATNTVALGVGPLGTIEPIWTATTLPAAVTAVNDINGGFEYCVNHCDEQFNPKQSYRFSLFVRQDNATGVLNFSCENAVVYPNGQTVGLPAFIPEFNLPELNKWFLLVGVVHGQSFTGTDDSSGIYDPATGQRVVNGLAFKSKVGVGTQKMRFYRQNATTNGSKLQMARPRIDIITGEEPSTRSLFGTANDIDKANKTTTVLGTGLAVGGGDLTTNREINVPKATSAQIAAGTNDTTAITPKGLKDNLFALVPKANDVDINDMTSDTVVVTPKSLRALRKATPAQVEARTANDVFVTPASLAGVTFGTGTPGGNGTPGGTGTSVTLPAKATMADVATGTDNDKMVTPLSLAGLKKATAADVSSGSSSTLIVTPASLAGLALPNRATTSDVAALTNPNLMVTPASLAGLPKATVQDVADRASNTKFVTPASLAGLVTEAQPDFATNQELYAGVSDDTVVSPKAFRSMAADFDDVNAGTDASKFVTPASLASSDIATAVTNFNASNDRNGSAIVAPVVANNGTAVDHVLNTDGSATISFEWTWSGDESLIDGFIVLFNVQDVDVAYPFNGTQPEYALFIPGSNRAIIQPGVAADKFYSFAVKAYRIVDADIDADGFIYSNLALCTDPAETPYQPTTEVAFSGNIVGTIGGLNASDITETISNFNDRNDRDGSPIASPILSTTGQCIDHTKNTDGSVDLSFEWAWPTADNDPTDAQEASIDGFIIYYRISATDSAEYTFTNPSEEFVLYTESDKRAIILPGVAADKYYSFGVRAYRAVDQDIDPSGIIRTPLITPSRAGEKPYKPEEGVAFLGNILGTLNNMPVTDITDTVQNFNDRNDRLSTPVAAPVIASNGTAIDHVLNNDSSCDISFEWSWTGDQTTIDGFYVIYHVAPASGVTPPYHTFNSPATEVVIPVPADRRAIFLIGVGADKYYSFSVLAYRIVDNDINNTGVIKSTLALCTGAGEAPYRPTANLAFVGELTGTIDGESQAYIADAARNFNLRNDRDGTPVASPVIPHDGTAIDHVLNTDGSATISFEWQFSAPEASIDGFILYRNVSSTNASSDFTTPASELVVYLPANKRSVIIPGVPADRYYTFGIRSYRIVDSDISSAAGSVFPNMIVSPVIVPGSDVGENPYQPSSEVAFRGKITGTIGTTAVATVEAAVANFNTRNDRNGEAIVLPVIRADGTAVDHILNKDGSATLSFEWVWTGQDADIDGFIVYHNVGTTNATHNFTTATSEMAAFVPANMRAIVLAGVPADSYYSFGVRAYRIVDADIAAGGFIQTAIVTPQNAGEQPYQPSNNVAFAGDITGTINGVGVASVTSAIQNFNTRNDRLGTAIAAPTVLTNGTALNHINNADGSVSITFNWNWTGVENDIDGFIVYEHVDSTSAPFTNFTGSKAEAVIFLPADRRSAHYTGVPATRYYSFGVRAYRVVDPDINNTGFIYSAIALPSGAEMPYRPRSTTLIGGDNAGNGGVTTDSLIASVEQAGQALTLANTLGTNLSGFTDDGVITYLERTIIRRELVDAAATRAKLRENATAVGLTLELVDEENKWQDMLLLLTSMVPPYTSTSATSSPINRLNYNAALTLWKTALQTLANRVAILAADTAEWDQVTGVNKPADNATANPQTAYVYFPTSFEKNAGLNGTFDAQVRSDTGFTGDFTLRFKVDRDTLGRKILVGVTSNPAPATRDDFTGAFEFSGVNGVSAVYYTGATVTELSAKTMGIDADYEINRTGTTLSFSIDGVRIATRTIAAGLNLFVDSSFRDAGRKVYKLTVFGPAVTKQPKFTATNCAINVAVEGQGNFDGKDQWTLINGQWVLTASNSYVAAGPFYPGQISKPNLSGGAGYNAGAYSIDESGAIRVFPVGSKLFFRIPNTNGAQGSTWNNFMLGFNVDPKTSASSSDLDLAMELSAPTTVTKVINGVVGSTTATVLAGEWLYFEIGDADTYLKRAANGSVIFTYAGQGGVSMAVDSSFKGTNSRVDGLSVVMPNGDTVPVRYKVNEAADGDLLIVQDSLSETTQWRYGNETRVLTSGMWVLAGTANVIYRQSTPPDVNTPTLTEGDTWVAYNDSDPATDPVYYVFRATPSRQWLLVSTVGAPPGTNVGGVPATGLVTDTATALANASKAIGQISDIVADNILSPDEKRALIIEWARVIAEKNALAATATSLGSYAGLTPAKDLMVSTFNALAAYLTVLTTPKAWDDVTGNTTIVGSTFTAKWTSYYQAVGALIAKMNEAAAATANWSSVTGVGKPADNATANIYRGEWSNGSVYAVGDFVTYLGSAYSVLVAHTADMNDMPPNTNLGLLSSGANTKLVTLSYANQFIRFGSDGSPKPLSQVLSFTANLQNTTEVNATWSAVRYNSSNASLGTITLGGSGNTRTLSEAQFGSASYVRITATAATDALSDSVTVIRTQDGEAVLAGYLTNESITLSADAAGTVSSYATAAGTFRVFFGSTNVTTSCAFSVTNQNGCAVSINSTGGYVVTSMSADNASATLEATYGGITVVKTLTTSVSKSGDAGIVGYLTNESHVVPALNDGTVSSFIGAGGTFKVTYGLTDVTGNKTAYTVASQSGVNVSINATTGVYTINSMDTDIGVASFRCVFSGSNPAVTVDKVYSITKSKAGNTGRAGANGATAKVMTLVSTHQTFTYTATGTIKPQTTILNAARQNPDFGVTEWLANRLDGTNAKTGSASAFAATPYWTSSDADTLSMTHTQFSQFCTDFSTDGLIMEARLNDDPGVRDRITIVRLKDGATSVTGYLTNEDQTLAADSSGTVTSYAPATGAFKVYYGSTDVSTGASTAYAVNTSSNCVGTINATTGVYSITSMSGDQASLTLTATTTAANGGVVVTKVFSISKSRGGTNGVSAKTLTLVSDRQIIAYDGTGAIVANQTVSLRAYKQNTASPVSWALTTAGGVPLAPTYFTGSTGTRTNYIAFSEKMGATASSNWWADSLVTVNANTVIAPDGTPTADLIIPNTSSGTHRIARSGFGTGTASEVVTVSVYAKAFGADYLHFTFPIVNSNASVFNVTLGTISSVGSGWSNATVADAGNGWYRFSITGTTTAATANTNGFIVSNTTSSVSTGNGSAGIALWGAQMTVEASAGNYIRTDGSAVSVATGEALTLSGANFATAADAQGVIVTASTTDGAPISDSLSVNKVQAGSNAITAFLTNEAHTVAADASGNVSDFAAASGAMKVYYGVTDISTGASTVFSAVASGCTGTINATTGAYSVTAMTGDTAVLTCTAVTASAYGSNTVSKVFSINKSRIGAAGVSAKVVTLTNDRQAILYDGLGALSPGGTAQSVRFDANKRNTTNVVNWTITKLDGTPTDTVSAANYFSSTAAGGTGVSTGDTVFMTPAQFSAARGTTNGVIVKAEVVDGFPISDTATVIRLQAGTSAISGYLTNEAQTLGADNAGIVSSYAPATGTFKVFFGSTDITTSAVTYSVGAITPASSITGSINSTTGVYSVTGMTVDTASIEFIATTSSAYGSVTTSKVFALAKSKAGAQGLAGANATLFTVGSDRQSITYSNNAASPLSQTTTITGTQSSGNNATVNWTIGSLANASVPLTPVTNYLSSATGGSVTMTAAQFEAARGSSNGVVITGSITTNGVTLSDPISIVRIDSGSTAVVAYLTNEGAVLAADSAGNVGDYSGAGGTMKVFYGSVDVTTGVGTTYSGGTIAGGSASGCVGTINASSGVYSISSMSADSAWIDFTSVTTSAYGSVTTKKRLTLAKSKTGASGNAGSPGTAGTPGTSPKLLQLTSDRQTIVVDGTGALNPSGTAQSIRFIAATQNTTGGIAWTVTKLDGTATPAGTFFSTTAAGGTNTTAGPIVYMTPSQFDAARDNTGGVIVTATSDGLSDTTSIVRIQSGANALVGYLTNESYTIAADSAGNTAALPAGGVGSFKVFYGITDVTSSCTFAQVASSGITASINSSGAYAVTAITGDGGSSTLRATYNSASIDKVFSVVKARSGAAGSPGTAGTNGTNGANAKTLIVISDRQTISYNSLGQPTPSTQTTTFTAQKQNTSATVGWSITDTLGNSLSVAYLSASSGDSVTLTSANFNSAAATYGATGVIVTGSISDGTTISDKVSILKVVDGATGNPGGNGTPGTNGTPGANGTPGSNAVIAFLTNEVHTVATDSSGNGGAYGAAGGTMRVFNGLTEVTTGYGVSYSVLSATAVSISINASGQYTVSGLSADQGTATLRAAYNPGSGTINLDKTYTITKSKSGSAGTPGGTGTPGTPGGSGTPGSNGLNAKTLTIISDRQTIAYDSAGNYVGSQTVTFSAIKQNTTATVTWSITDINGNAVSAAFLSSTTGDQITLPANNFNTARNGSVGVIVTGSLNDGGVLTDKISVVMVKEGSTGTPGSPGNPGTAGSPGATTLTGYLTNESHTLPTDVNGVITSYAGASGTFRVLYGTTDVTEQCSFSYSSFTPTGPGGWSDGNNCALSNSSGSRGNYSVFGDMFAGGAAASMTYAAYHPTYGTIFKTFSLVKVGRGANGTPGNPGGTGTPGNNGTPGNPGGAGTPGSNGTPGTPGNPGSPGGTGPAGRAAIAYYQESYNAPSGQVTGDVWFQSDVKRWLRWNGSQWIQVLGQISQFDIIDANVVSAGYIAAKAIGANTLNVNELSAITATIGLLRTATGGQRLEIENNQLRVYDVNNVCRVRLGLF